MPIRFPPGSQFTHITLDIENDTLFEGPEQFLGRLQSTSTIANLNITVDTVTIHIVDDDGMQE